jgi:tetratricopeptide (TPR) repeat protein
MRLEDESDSAALTIVPTGWRRAKVSFITIKDISSGGAINEIFKDEVPFQSVGDLINAYFEQGRPKLAQLLSPYKDATTPVQAPPVKSLKGRSRRTVSSLVIYVVLAIVSRFLFGSSHDYSSSQNNNNGNPCHDYYYNADYPAAISACTKLVDKTGSPEARFWRARAYDKSGNKAAAEKDYTVLADSDKDSYFRDNAAIDLGVIYGDRNDFQGMLKLFDKDSYIFDKQTRDKQTLAIAYNNRCYAYMQLGQLLRALDDCNVSLQYGNIPEAVEKHRDLLQLLQQKH